MDWNILGLILNWGGVIVLFRFAMPYRVRTGGQDTMLLESSDTNAVKTEGIYDVLGWIGLALITVGTGLQVMVALGVHHA